MQIKKIYMKKRLKHIRSDFLEKELFSCTLGKMKLVWDHLELIKTR